MLIAAVDRRWSDEAEIIDIYPRTYFTMKNEAYVQSIRFRYLSIHQSSIHRP